MPRKPKYPCSHPSCPNTRRRYGRAWKRIRDKYVSQHPFCEMCYECGILVKTEEVHHKRKLSDGGTHDRENLIVLAIMAVITAISYLWNNWEASHEFWTGVWEKIKSTALTVVELICKGVVSKVTNIKNSIVNGFNSVVVFIKDLAKSAYTWGR